MYVLNMHECSRVEHTSSIPPPPRTAAVTSSKSVHLQRPLPLQTTQRFCPPSLRFLCAPLCPPSRFSLP
jgi:hypothetical protein